MVKKKCILNPLGKPIIVEFTTNNKDHMELFPWLYVSWFK